MPDDQNHPREQNGVITEYLSLNLKEEVSAQIIDETKVAETQIRPWQVHHRNDESFTLKAIVTQYVSRS